MPEAGKQEAARKAQSKYDKAATIDALINKKRHETTFSIYLEGEDGEETEVTLTFRAIGMKAYDKLVSKHPPKPDQRVDGASFNMDTFAPALIAACSVVPEL